MSRSPQHGVFLGGGGGAAYVEFPQGVVALTCRGVRLMPNGIALPSAEIPPNGPGVEAFLTPGMLRFGGVTVQWEDAQSYDLVLTGLRSDWAEARAFSPDGGALGTGLTTLVDGLVRADVGAIERASYALLGRGRGLTPEGDDILVGAVAAAVAFGVPSNIVAAVLEPDVESRTTTLSATLLRLAVQGRVVEPLLRLLNDDLTEVGEAQRCVLSVGNTTGRCYLRAVMAMVSARYAVPV